MSSFPLLSSSCPSTRLGSDLASMGARLHRAIRDSYDVGAPPDSHPLAAGLYNGTAHLSYGALLVGNSILESHSLFGKTIPLAKGLQWGLFRCRELLQHEGTFWAWPALRRMLRGPDRGRRPTPLDEAAAAAKSMLNFLAICIGGRRWDDDLDSLLMPIDFVLPHDAFEACIEKNLAAMLCDSWPIPDFESLSPQLLLAETREDLGASWWLTQLTGGEKKEEGRRGAERVIARIDRLEEAFKAHAESIDREKRRHDERLHQEAREDRARILRERIAELRAGGRPSSVRKPEGKAGRKEQQAERDARGVAFVIQNPDATIDEVAAHLGVHRGTVYNYPLTMQAIEARKYRPRHGWKDADGRVETEAE